METLSVVTGEKQRRQKCLDGQKRLLVIQETVCEKCSVPVDPTDTKLRVDYVDVELHGKKLAVMNPFCPFCQGKVKARLHLVN